MDNLQKMYEGHHAGHRDQGFSILKEARGPRFSNLIGKGKRVLDIGCRDGALTSFFVADNMVTGADIDSVALARARKNIGIETVELDLYSDWSALSGRAFDVVVAGEVLEHLFFPEKILGRICDHLEHGGSFVGSVPNAFSMKNRLRLLFAKKDHTPLHDPTHVNHFAAKELRELLSRYFFDVEIFGLGKHAFLAKTFPNLLAFDLIFMAKGPRDRKGEDQRLT